jgi:hypothetical protein
MESFAKLESILRRTKNSTKDDRWFWDDIPRDHELRDVYDYLHEEKMKHLRGESDESSQRLTQKKLESS